jgi:hypothetical protein
MSKSDNVNLLEIEQNRQNEIIPVFEILTEFYL